MSEPFDPQGTRRKNREADLAALIIRYERLAPATKCQRPRSAACTKNPWECSVCFNAGAVRLARFIMSAAPASPQSGPTVALEEPNTELGATRGEDGDVFGATNEELADYIRDQVCCPRIHGCELGGSPECPAERVRAALSTPKTPSQGREWINLDVLPFWPWLWADPFRDDVDTRKEMAERRLRANYEVARDPIPNQYALVHRADLISQMHELWTLRARVSAAPPSPEGVLKGKQGDRASSADSELAVHAASTEMEGH